MTAEDAASSPIAFRSSTVARSRLRPHEPHPLVHGLERGRGGGTRLVGADGEQPPELRLVGAERLVALPDRVEQLDDRLRHVRLELAVALPVVAALDRV